MKVTYTHEPEQRCILVEIEGCVTAAFYYHECPDELAVAIRGYVHAVHDGTLVMDRAVIGRKLGLAKHPSEG